MIVLSIIITNILPSFVCLGGDLNSMAVSGLTGVSSIQAMRAEVWSRFWSWNLVEIFRMNFSRDFKANQLARWLKSNYFGERTQTLSVLVSCAFGLAMFLKVSQPQFFLNVLVRNVLMYICFAVIYARHKIAIKSRNAIYLNPESIKQYI